MELPWKDLLTLYGPLALGWPLFGWMLYELLKAKKEHNQDIKTLLESDRTALNASTNAIETNSVHLEQMNRAFDRMAGAVERNRERR